MTAYTWDGKKFVNEAGKPVFARYDKYGGCYVYEEDTPMTAHTINAPLVERYKELARDADEKRRLENAASPSMQYLLIENNRVCAERDAALKQVEIERAANLTLRQWFVEANEMRAEADDAAQRRAIEEDYTSYGDTLAAMNGHPPEQPITESDAPRRFMRHLLNAVRELEGERDALRKELEVERAANLTLRSWMAENNDYAKGYTEGLAAGKTVEDFARVAADLIDPAAATSQDVWSGGWCHTPGPGAKVAQDPKEIGHMIGGEPKPPVTEQHAPLLRATRQKP